ncbi:hypothetical protein [Plesiocystis pacifica]|uniref:hypothetical protein n=1 Tax=Plesiocystis pacifica TaxID=191768 RepID=UPI0012F769EA|nr:hypothetical protein [Plesiocystis pacifica]
MTPRSLAALALALTLAAGCSEASGDEDASASSSTPAPSEQAEPDPAPEPPEGAVQAVALSQVYWSSSNPSLGPHEVTSSASVGPGSFESPAAWEAAAARLLDDTKVNGVASLREYMLAVINKDGAALARISAADNDELREGGGYASLALTTTDGQRVRISNLKQTRLSGRWSSFWDEHLRGRIVRDEPPGEVLPVLKDEALRGSADAPPPE